MRIAVRLCSSAGLQIVKISGRWWWWGGWWFEHQPKKKRKKRWWWWGVWWFEHQLDDLCYSYLDFCIDHLVEIVADCRILTAQNPRSIERQILYGAPQQRRTISQTPKIETPGQLSWTLSINTKEKNDFADLPHWCEYNIMNWLELWKMISEEWFSSNIYTFFQYLEKSK